MRLGAVNLTKSKAVLRKLAQYVRANSPPLKTQAAREVQPRSPSSPEAGTTAE